MAAALGRPVANTDACSPAGPRSPSPIGASPSFGRRGRRRSVDVGDVLVPHHGRAHGEGDEGDDDEARRVSGLPHAVECGGSRHEDDAADGLAALDVGVGRGRLGQRERAVDDAPAGLLRPRRR